MRYELYTFMLDLAKKEGSLYKGSRIDRVHLLNLMDERDWPYGKPVFDGDQVFLNSPGLPSDDFTLWLAGYGRPEDEKLDLLLQHYEVRFPETCRLCCEFFEGSFGSGWKGKNALQLADHVLFNCSDLSMELTDFKAEDLHHMIVSSACRLPQRDFSILVDLARRLDSSFDKREYRVKPGTAAQMDNGAYSGPVYFGIAWFVLNRQSWSENRLLEKACADPGHAKLWLTIALSCCCGLRGTDLRKLPPPRITPPLKEEARRILDSPDSLAEAAELVRIWEMQIKSLDMAPNKTRKDMVPSITFRIAAPVRDVVGIILCTVLLGWKEGEALTVEEAKAYRLRSFFGQEFVDLLDGCAFSLRRSTKSYLQGLSVAGGYGEGFAEGYDVASLARSHKGGLTTLARTTDVYLRDASFAGYTADYALLQLFLRGPFSWLTVMLLEAYDKKRWNCLTAQSQTDLITSFSLTPFQLERLTAACSRAMEKAEEFIPQALSQSGGPDTVLAGCLERIRESIPQGVQEGYACLKQAAGLPCPSARRARGCPGCSMELLSKAFVQCLVDKYIDLAVRVRNAPDKEVKDRLSRIFNQGLTPLVEAVPGAFEGFAPGTDQSIVNNLILKGANTIKNGIENRTD